MTVPEAGPQIPGQRNRGNSGSEASRLPAPRSSGCCSSQRTVQAAFEPFLEEKLLPPGDPGLVT